LDVDAEVEVVRKCRRNTDFRPMIKQLRSSESRSTYMMNETL